VGNFQSAHFRLAATYAQLGELDKARAEVDEVLRVNPNYTIEGTQRQLSMFKRPEDAEHFFDGLRKAGLPER
jgi:adenylate cyclase